MEPKTPSRVQRQRTAGWKMPPRTRYVGRPTVFGNPFAPARIPGWATASREYAVADFRAWLTAPDLYWRRAGYADAKASTAARDRLLAALGDLVGLDLACWCPTSQPCHADVLIELVAGLGDRPEAESGNKTTDVVPTGVGHTITG